MKRPERATRVRRPSHDSRDRPIQSQSSQDRPQLTRGVNAVRILLAVLIIIGLLLIRSFLSGGQSKDTVGAQCVGDRQYCADIMLDHLKWDRASNRYNASLTLRIASPPRRSYGEGSEVNDVRFRLHSEDYWLDYLRDVKYTHAGWQPAERSTELSNPTQVAAGLEVAMRRDVVELKRDEVPVRTKHIRGRSLFPFDAYFAEIEPEGCSSEQRNLEAFLCFSPHASSFSPARISLQTDEAGLIIQCEDPHGGPFLCTIRRSSFVALAAILLLLTPGIFILGASTVESAEALLLRAGGFWVSFAAARTFLPPVDLPFPTLLDFSTLVLFVIFFGVVLGRGTLRRKGDDHDKN
jgi:hypothetical protein